MSSATAAVGSLGTGTSTADQVIANVARGLTQVQVARMLGVDESYVSQVVNSEDGAAAIKELAAATSEINAKFDEDLDSAEEVALSRVRQRLGTANMQQALAAFKILNAANRRRDTAPATRQQVGEIHQVVLPQTVINNYVMNAQSEIVEVNGRTMVSATAQQLPKLLQQRLNRTLPDKSTEMSEDKKARTVQLLTDVKPAQRRRSSAADLDITDII